MVIIASESVDTFDRNGWSTSIGMGGQDGPEYAMNHCLKGSCHAIRFIKAESLQHAPQENQSARIDFKGQESAIQGTNLPTRET